MSLFTCPSQNPSILSIPSQYPLAIGVALLMSWQLWYYGIQISGYRKRFFTAQFMRENWGQIHKKEIGEQIQLGGLPDTGNGIYSHKLPYKDWYTFNVVQRLHLNYVEGINLAQLSMLAAALYKPRQAAILGLFYIIGKLIFASGYQSKMGGLSKRRIFGVAFCYLASVINTAIFAFYLIKKMKG